MQAKKNLQLIFLILLLVPFAGTAQIVTTKKEAVKKGIYQKPSEKKADNAATGKTAKTIAYNDNKSQQIKAAKSTPTKSKKNLINDTEDNDLVLSPQENYLAVQMINNAMGFIGVKYHGGGTTIAGMDCSGMITAVFNIFDMELPRSSIQMAKVGEKIDNKDAKKGDLIFFKTNGRSVINHVGMVVEVLSDEIKFIHSSTHSGVIISSTKEPYYKRTFAQVNRVL
jgi:cell wall-associated NlpC family hydrolase